MSSNLLTCSQKRVLLRKISLLQERNNLVYSYNDKKGEGIGVLRYKGLCEIVANINTFVEPQTLPPNLLVHSIIICEYTSNLDSQ